MLPDAGGSRAGRALLASLSLGLVLSLCVCWPAAAAPSDVRAVVALRINEIDTGAIIVVLRGPDVLVPVADLVAAGLREVEGVRETIGGQTLVSLLSLAPEIHFALDEKGLVLRLEARASSFGTAVLDMNGGPPPGILYSSDSSAFVNYAVKWSRTDRFSGFAEAGWSLRGNLLYSSVLRRPDGSFIRGLSHFDVDDRARLRRWTLGDSFTETGVLGGGAFLAGVSLSRDFDLDPYFVRFPRFGFSGAVSAPSTVDVYVNGALVRREELPPGQFDLRNIPIVSGSGSVRFVVRDVFGQERAIASPYYFSAGLLAAGLSDYSYNVGVARRNIGTKSADYGEPMFLARHRAGLTNSVTLGGRLEAARGLVSGGPSATMRLPLGELDLAASGSRQSGQTGGAASLAYSYIGPLLSVGTSLRAMSDHYANASLPPAMDREILEGGFVAGAQVVRGFSLSAQYTASKLRDGGRRAVASLSASVQVAAPATLFFSAGRSRDKDKGWATEVFAGLTYWMGARTTGSLTLDSRGGTAVSTAEVQRPLPRGEG
ncbi:MAG TPA: fimbria/pilus outer membrane usher protein, partial [Thermoanaerobaculia bacterium]|nr:fimbria/pilus outer membrane usher protein [Thermoanaerobaculia bacterium]